MKNLLIITLSILLFSCANQKSASRKIHRKLDKVGKLVRLYPELSDSILTTKIDTIEIKGSSDSVTYVLKKDTLYIDSILKVYEKLYSSKLDIEKQILDSLDSFDSLGFDIKSATEKENELYRIRLKSLNNKKRLIETELENLKKELVSKTIQDSYFEYSDKYLDANIEIIKGKLELVYKIKDKEIIHETKTKSIEVKKKSNLGLFFSRLIKLVMIILVAFGLYKVIKYFV